MSDVTTSSPSADRGATADLLPPRISEIVLKTSRFEIMKGWYQLVLSATPTLEYDAPGDGPYDTNRTVNFHRLCFLRVYQEFPYTEVLALFEIPDLKADDKITGLHHMQFRVASLDALADRYDRLAGCGIRPYKTYNHGPSTSFYYEDPDGNLVELSGPNYATSEAYHGFFRSEAFKRNPVGVPIDAETFLSALRSGQDRDALVRLPA